MGNLHSRAITTLDSPDAVNHRIAVKPRFISFDCYGTLIDFAIGPTAKALFEDRVPAERMPAFLDSFRAYRLDEVLGDWKPFFSVPIRLASSRQRSLTFPRVRPSPP
jgi:FMN phosphatase YigB (HAD superfamily)